MSKAARPSRRKAAPRKPARRRPGARVAARPPAPRPAVGTLHLRSLGSPVEITYRHADGRLMRHRFGRAARLAYTLDGSAIVVTGATVKPFIEG